MKAEYGSVVGSESPWYSAFEGLNVIVAYVQAEVQVHIEHPPSLLGVISVEAQVRQFDFQGSQCCILIDLDLDFDFDFDIDFFDSEHFWRGWASSIVSHSIIDVVLLWLM